MDGDSNLTVQSILQYYTDVPPEYPIETYIEQCKLRIQRDKEELRVLSLIKKMTIETESEIRKKLLDFYNENKNCKKYINNEGQDPKLKFNMLRLNENVIRRSILSFAPPRKRFYVSETYTYFPGSAVLRLGDDNSFFMSFEDGHYIFLISSDLYDDSILKNTIKIVVEALNMLPCTDV